jgi:surface polysaccharide O-acyltransferase-like enzyme
MPSPITSAQSGSAPQPAARLHYLDTLRVLSIGMVFLFHAVHPFDFGDWQVKNAEQSEILTIILLFLGMWGMPFFFLLAGAGSRFALQRRTARQYASERFYRLFIPFLAGSILFWPIEYYCEYMNKIQRGVLNYFPGFLSAFTIFNPRLLRFPGWSPRWFGVAGYHLWFLGFLFSFALITLPFFLWLKNKSGQETLSWMAKGCEHRGGLLLFAIPAGMILCLLLPLFPLDHDWAHFALYLFFFALGFILFADERFAHAVRRDWPLLLTVGSVIVAGLVGVYLAGLPVLTWSETPGIPAFYVVQVLRAVIAVCFSLTTLFVGMRFMDFTNKWLRYGQEAIMPFFVLHQPVIVVIAFFVVQWNAGILVKLPVVVLSSFLVTLGLYELIVRRVRPLRLLLGIKARSSD